MTPKCFVATINLKHAQKLKSDLHDKGFHIQRPQYTLFQAKKSGLSVTLYESGKLTVQGKEMHEFITFYLEPEILGELSYTNPHKDVDRTPHIGSDEAGKGDFFGPLVVCALYADADQIDELLKLGVRDSKRIQDKVIAQQAGKIERLCTHEIVAIFPEKYNTLYEKFGNLNHLLAWAHSCAIKAVMEKSGCDAILVDKFAHESLLEKHLPNTALTQKTKAESDPVVAAASILARNAFVKGLQKLSYTYDINLPK